MVPVDDEGSVEEFGSAGPHPALHDRVHARDADAGLHDGDALGVEDRVEGVRVAAVTVADQVLRGGPRVLEVHGQGPGQLRRPGRGGMRGGARIRTRRVACSMAAKTCSRAPVSVRVSKKSAARIACAWPCRKAAQVWRSRPGTGSMPASLRISQTVDG